MLEASALEIAGGDIGVYCHSGSLLAGISAADT